MHRPDLRKQDLLTIANIKETYRAFRSKTSSRTYGKMHRISRIFDRIRTTLRMGDFPPTEGWEIPPPENSANTEEFCEIFRKFKLFARFLQGFLNFFLGVLLQKTHIFADFRTSFQFSQCYSIFATFAIFAIGVSLCFAKFRKSCFASFASTSFAMFRNYKFRSLMFVSQDSQGFANTSFRKLSQIKLSPGFANRFFVSQGFASFARL